ncbi:hypothetical protein PROFUN_06697 [Planoprotostelium fungivorum]|uniref:Uncharacterized protein n=1 Tax=Planoprotostelium fungivorum TaxID=1890364 RepID=A0A2P6NG41_9EUKA|nr:hypothetical protein PROFUN_06697 [Planoprotostelium fungivorum]
MIKTRAGTTDEDSELDSTVLHHLPFAFTDHEGTKDVRVSTYFLQQDVEGKPGIKSAAFRGVELMGRSIAVPDDYQGLVIRDDTGEETEEKEPIWQIQNRFTSFTEWRREVIHSHASVPHASQTEPDAHNSSVGKMLQWMDFLPNVHSKEITEEQIVARMAMNKEQLKQQETTTES